MDRKLEIWGGVECTVNRVGDVFHDQMALSGHDIRLEDLDLIAAAGIKVLRYPALWEKICPERPDEFDWSWTDERLERLRSLGIEPILGLLHHGSGPKYTSLHDPNFVRLFANFASAVAQRYPWVSKYTPVNEPLTTARFSGLYGHWYPHGKDDRSFFNILIHECAGTVRAMQKIRRVNPQAQLIQTEDMGKVYATPPLRYQAEFENERRWLSLDLLTGQLKPAMMLYKRMLKEGIDERLIRWFDDQNCPPDVIGINHYLTSERLLDHRMERYPQWSHGGNETDRYADIEAVRVCKELGNIELLLKETWERFRLPIAMTEVHLGDSVQEQKLWLLERWCAAKVLRDRGVDIRALAIWALFGSFDWNCLVTKLNGHYEPGLFDVRTNPPQPSGLMDLVLQLQQTEELESRAEQELGWWQRTDRYQYPVLHVQHGCGATYCVAYDEAENTEDLAA